MVWCNAAQREVKYSYHLKVFYFSYIMTVWKLTQLFCLLIYYNS